MPDQRPTLGPGDILKVMFFGQPELSGEYLVDQDGTIQYPLAGRVDVSGHTRSQAGDALRHALRDVFEEPEIDVTLLIRVTVVGAVVRPGVYPVDPTLSVFDVVGLAGGPTSNAQFDRFLLVRDGEFYLVDTEAALRAGRALTQLSIRSGDVVMIPERPRPLDVIARYITAAVSLLNTVLILATR